MLPAFFESMPDKGREAVLAIETLLGNYYKEPGITVSSPAQDAESWTVEGHKAQTAYGGQPGAASNEPALSDRPGTAEEISFEDVEQAQKRLLAAFARADTAGSQKASTNHATPAKQPRGKLWRFGPREKHADSSEPAQQIPSGPTSEEIAAKQAVFTPDAVKRACGLIDAALPVVRQSGEEADDRNMCSEESIQLGGAEQQLQNMRYCLADGKEDGTKIDTEYLAKCTWKAGRNYD